MALLKDSPERHTVRRLIIAPAILALVTGLSSTAHAQNERLGSGFEAARVDGNHARLAAPIEGTWILTIDRVNQGISFSALQSFTAGGVTLATGTADRTPPPPISPLYGSWRRTGHNSYVAVICFFVFDPTGKALAMIKTPETFHVVDNDNLTGSGTGLACDINGDNCVDLNSTITITGKRLIAEEASN
jgi:hypothetical protein